MATLRALQALCSKHGVTVIADKSRDPDYWHEITLIAPPGHHFGELDLHQSLTRPEGTAGERGSWQQCIDCALRDALEIIPTIQQCPADCETCQELADDYDWYQLPVNA